MDRVFRNILFYSLIFIVLIGVISLFKSQGYQSTEYNVKEFMHALEKDEIAEMTMQPKDKIIRITGELNEEDKEFAVNVPDDTKVINNIIDETEGKGVLKVEPEEQPSVFVNFLTMMLPFLKIGRAHV